MNRAGAVPRVAAVVVHYGPWSSTERALEALRAHAPGVPVVVVDNAGTAPPRTGIRVLEPGRNLGYGAAANLAARETDSEFLLLLNNDVEIQAGMVAALVEALDRAPRAAAAGPRHLDASGRPVRSIFRAPGPRRVLFESLLLPRLFPGIPFFHGHHTVFTPHGRPRDVETLSGAAILLRRAALEDVRGFDEAFFFYAEESDLFARLWNAGWAVRFEPAARVVHHGGVASRELPQQELDARLHDALRLYARRHHGEEGERRTARALLWGARLRRVLALFQPGDRGRERRQRYADILRRSGGG